jgi:hypothetical protein
MVSHNGIGKVGVQPHTRSQGNRQIGEQAHAERCQSSNGSCRSNQVPLNFEDAQAVGRIGVARRVFGKSRADACTTSVGYNRCCTLSGVLCQRHSVVRTVHGDDVGHSEEGRKTCAELGREVAAFALFGLWTC